MNKPFSGIITALITPFQTGGEVDFFALEKLIQRQLDAKIDGLALCATTGEGSSLTIGEREKIITFCLEKTAAKCKVIVGTGTNALEATVENTIMAQELGCDGALVVTPYYNKPTPEGLHRYFMQVLEKTGIPVILYNVPSRTAVDMQPDTVATVASHERCAGIKEATGDVVRVLEIRKRVKENFSILGGDDATFLPLLACGGDGIICTSSNVIPAAMVQLYAEWTKGNIEKARDTHSSLLDVYRAMFAETNPGPVKLALFKMGLIEPSVRPPLVLPGTESPAARVIETALRNHELL